MTQSATLLRGLTIALALWTAGCSCGSCGSATVPDGGGPDGGRPDGGGSDSGGPDSGGPDTAGDVAPQQWDAGPCSYGLYGDIPPATHQAIVAYDHQLEPDPGSNPAWSNPDSLFVDDDGVAVFGQLRLVRATLDGTFLSSKDSLGEVMMVAQGDTNYGVVYSVQNSAGATERQFCIVTRTGQMVACPRVDSFTSQVGELTWDGSAYTLLTRSPDKLSFTFVRYDGAGNLLGELPLALPPYAWGTPRFVGDTVQFLAFFFTEAVPCELYHLVVFPRSLDPAARHLWNLMPADFRAVTDDRQIVTTGQRTALFYEGRCFQPRPGAPPDEEACNNNWPRDAPRVSFLTMVGEDSAPLDPLRRQMPSFSLPKLHWDGARFVVLEQQPGAPANPTIHAFDKNGEFVVWSTSVPLGAGGTPTGVRMVPVGDNDYIAAYRSHTTGATQIARFSLEPL